MRCPGVGGLSLVETDLSSGPIPVLEDPILFMLRKLTDIRSKSDNFPRMDVPIMPTRGKVSVPPALLTVTAWAAKCNGLAGTQPCDWQGCFG